MAVVKTQVIPCATGRSPRRLSEQLLHFGVTSTLYDSPAPLETLLREISQNRVVLVGTEFFVPEGGIAGHAVLVVGWEQSDQGPFLIVHDPIRGVVSDWYEDLLSSYGRGEWFCTWTGLGR